MGLSLQIKKEGIISAMDILVNCAKSDSARVISGIYASGNAVYTTATMKASIYNGKQNLVFYNTKWKQSTVGNSGSCKCNSSGGNGRYRISAEIKAEYVVKRSWI